MPAGVPFIFQMLARSPSMPRWLSRLSNIILLLHKWAIALHAQLNRTTIIIKLIIRQGMMKILHGRFSGSRKSYSMYMIDSCDIILCYTNMFAYYLFQRNDMIAKYTYISSYTIR